MNDIIDNRSKLLVDHIKGILPAADRAKFAVGYFFLSGLAPIEKHLDGLKELRLLIGNTTNRETLEQLTEGYRRLELVEKAADEFRFAKRADQRRWARETAENLRDAVGVMDQTDEGEAIVRTLIRLIEEKRLKVRVYTKGRLHAKAYIFDFKTPNPGNEGIAIVGSSNLSLAGITHNTELNVIVHDNGNPLEAGSGNHGALTRWFNELWEEAQDFEPYLMEELRSSWAVAPVRPYDIYMKTLYTLVKDRLEEAEGKEILWDDEITRALADFQKVAVRQAIQMIRDYGGCFVADVVGLGKSYIGSAILKHFERTEHARPLIICPKPLEEMWDQYNEVYHLNARILPMSLLRETDEEGVNKLLEDVRYRDRDVVLVDESHNFRHHTIQRYHVLQTFLQTGRKCCFLTATPRNKTAWDLYHQIRLFQQEDIAQFPVDPPDLRAFFKGIEKGEKRLQDLLKHVLIRRRRKQILRWYGYAEDTQRPLRELSEEECCRYLDGTKRAYVLVGAKHQFFPRRELETLRYSIDDSYRGIYQQIRTYLGRPRGARYRPKPGEELTYARYGLWHYVRKEKQNQAPYNELHRAGINLRGIMRVLLFKRLESSVHAFRETVRRLVRIHDAFLKSLDAGVVPAGEKAQEVLYESDSYEEGFFLDVIERLRALSERYDVADFDVPLLREHIEADKGLLEKILALVRPITPDQDAKLQTFLARMSEDPLRRGKRLIFTQYADTARYLYDNLNPGGRNTEIDVIFGTDKSKARMAGRFAPKANPEYRFQKGEPEVHTLVTTDVMAEGLNLQDCDKVVNYELHWNPVRLIQRVGRIDRIGSEYEVIRAFNFLPETELERALGIRKVLERRIQEIHETIGEDSAILDESEQLNEEAMYAIYEGKSEQLPLFEGDDEDLVDINEAEELLRHIQRENPEEFRRIAELRDGIRTAKSSELKGHFVFCQAGKFQQLFLVDSEQKVTSRDVPKVLAAIKCTEAEKAQPLPKGYNRRVMHSKLAFDETVKHMQAERKHTVSLTPGQRYVLRELRVLFQHTEDEDTKAQINILEKAFRITPTGAVNRELNYLRRNGVVGKDLQTHLIRIYNQHRLRDRPDQRVATDEAESFAKIICSEALV